MTFQEYLEEKFSEELEIGGVPITKDNYEAMNDNWMSDLDVQEVIDLAEEWGQKEVKKAVASEVGSKVHQALENIQTSDLPDYMKLPPFPELKITQY